MGGTRERRPIGRRSDDLLGGGYFTTVNPQARRCEACRRRLGLGAVWRENGESRHLAYLVGELRHRSDIADLSVHLPGCDQ